MLSRRVIIEVDRVRMLEGSCRGAIMQVNEDYASEGIWEGPRTQHHEHQLGFQDPDWAQDAPKMPPSWASRTQDGPKMGPRCPQDAPKMPPRCPQDPPKIPPHGK